MGLAGLVDRGCVGVCQTSGDHASQEVPHHNASDPAVRLLESNDPAEAEHLTDGWRQLGLGNCLSHRVWELETTWPCGTSSSHDKRLGKNIGPLPTNTSI